MAKKKSTEREEAPASFEESLDELEKVVAELESGKLGLSDALARYEHGVKHLKSCQKLLQRAERRIEILSGVDADGNPITESYDDTESDSLEEKAAGRGQRRTSSTRATSGKGSPPASEIDDDGRLF